jgi:hypothetical protein
VGVTGRKIENTHPMLPYLYPKHSKTALQPIPHTGLNTPHEVPSPALAHLTHIGMHLPRPHRSCVRGGYIDAAGKLHYRPPWPMA